MRAITFRALSIDDMQSMFLWLLRPHVAKWYSAAPATFAEVVAKYGPRTQPESPVRAYVIAIDGRDAGYVQAYPISLFEEYERRLGAEAGVVGMDLFIGEEMFIGWGLGARAIRRFVDEVVFAQPGVPACVAGPVEGNAVSIRAFEKAGFRRWKAVDNERGERECVMRRERVPARYRLEPIDLGRDLATCVKFRRDMYVASFGSRDGLDEEMGEGDATYLEQLRQRVAQLPEGNVHLWEDDRIVGQTELRLDEEPGVGYVSLFYLAPEHRGQGVGKLLHDHAASVFRARGMDRMRLSVSTRNAAAIEFYPKLGWVGAGPRPHRLPMEVMEFSLR
jgi:RimJ/RimL family protein N-acetyltransferase